MKKNRKNTILKETVHEYIRSSNPVSSNTLLATKKINASPATIRNELNELEQEGYLQQVHTSSGRIPTDQGYRLFVESLMQPSSLSKHQKDYLSNQIQKMNGGLQDILTELSTIMTTLTQYTAITTSPEVYHDTLKIIHFIATDIGKVMVILLNSIGANKEFTINIKKNISQDDLNKLSKLMTEKLAGKNINQLDETLYHELINGIPRLKETLILLCQAITKAANQHKQKKLTFNGVANMLQLPEFKNIELTKNVLSTLEDNQTLLNILNNYNNDTNTKTNNVKVFIGSETNVKQLKECSLVITPIEKYNKQIGHLALLGPTRMAYPSIIPLVKKISTLFKETVDKKELDHSENHIKIEKK